MSITRRKFMVLAPVAAGFAAAGLNISTAAQSLSEVPERVAVTDALSKLGWDSFYQFINTDFTFGMGANAVSLNLVDMKDLRSLEKRQPDSQECFLLKFQGPHDRPLEQSTYKVEHFSLGSFDLFITVGDRRSRAFTYQALINRITH